MSLFRHKVESFLIRIVVFPISFLSFPAIRRIANMIGILSYYLMHKFRKRTLSNLALASKLKLSNHEIKKLAKSSFKNLATTVLEYSKLSRLQFPNKQIICKNPQVAEKILKQSKGLVFFVAHQANWEVLFLEGTSRMQGVAIGRPIKNLALYQWITSIREKCGGKMIPPKEGIKQGLKALKQGKFLGIVGDQGMPDSFFKSLFLGRPVYTSPIPALLAYKKNCPLIFAEVKRVHSGYEITYHDPFYPIQNEPQEQEISRLMTGVLRQLEKSIMQRPSEWLWQHNRFKQETPKNVYYRFRHDCILVVLPNTLQLFEKALPLFYEIEKIYPKAFISAFVHKDLVHHLQTRSEIIPYTDEKQLFLKDYRFKLVFNFTNISIDKHYLSLSAFEVLSFPKLAKLALPHLDQNEKYDLKQMLIYAIARKGSYYKVHSKDA